MPNLFDLLAKIHERPTMYVGGTNEDRRTQLLALELLLCGYGFAIDLHGVDDRAAGVLQRIGESLRVERGWSMSCGPIAAILKNSATGEDAWCLFWELVEKERALLESQRTA